MNVLRYFTLATFGLALAATAGCTSLNSKVGGVLKLDTDLTLTFLADTSINPDDKNRPSPLIIRLYELKSPQKFERANFLDLFERDSEILGPDMLAKQSLKRLKPGDERKDKFVLNPQTRYVGLLAEFLQYRDAKFKVVIPIAANNVVASSSTVRIAGNVISIGSGQTGSEPVKRGDTSSARDE